MRYFVERMQRNPFATVLFIVWFLASGLIDLWFKSANFYAFRFEHLRSFAGIIEVIAESLYITHIFGNKSGCRLKWPFCRYLPLMVVLHVVPFVTSCSVCRVVFARKGKGGVALLCTPAAARLWKLVACLLIPMVNSTEYTERERRHWTRSTRVLFVGGCE